MTLESSCELCATRTQVFSRAQVPGDPSTWRNAVAFVLRPLHQVSVGHMLVVTRRHHAYLWYLDSYETTYAAELQRKLARWLVDHGAQGVNVLHASGAAAGQSQLHTHWHVVPRYLHDGLDLWLRDRTLSESLGGSPLDEPLDCAGGDVCVCGAR